MRQYSEVQTGKDETKQDSACVDLTQTCAQGSPEHQAENGNLVEACLVQAKKHVRSSESVLAP